MHGFVCSLYMSKSYALHYAIGLNLGRQPVRLSLFGVIYFAFELAAIHCLKMKRLYEQRAEHLVNSQLRIYDQMIMLEGVKAATETVDVLTIRAAAMKGMQKAM